MSAIPAFKLVEAGFSQPQVEALAEFMQTEAARRSDLFEAKAELKADIAEVKAALKTEVLVLAERIERRSAESDAKLQMVRNELVRWVVGAGVAAIVTIIGTVVGSAWAIIRFLPPGH